ncbi:ABC transporter substrate-binding protein [Thermosipho atlanticus]|uniref:Carbohydrate ABC transporter substrate-binding protein, CUT1 family n=1 Tax=Thermosipho atlanticus DSM 15807 TaxID=1123380 RepID=A0A1M5TBG0_9BACT|nr:ABC transporter substrate-binding protein [Thermosipho atlanticus]SHH48031.1 carbohydrate ABC transporter substrate-binding protein, CUT1 family [Thermosipho atlanticus DSM 15807]
MKKVFLVFLTVLIVSMAFSVTTITISGWPGNPDEEAAIKAAVDEFNATHKDIQINWEPIPGNYLETLKTRLSAGTAPDIFYVDVYFFEELAGKNVLLPLDIFIKKDNFDLSAYFEPLVEAFKFNNRVYGIAKDFSTLALYYNKEIFDKYGVPYPTNDDTWFDLLDKALQLKRKGFETPLVLAADFNRVIPFILGAGGKLVDENLNTALDTPASRFGIKFYIDMVTKYKVAVEPQQVGAGWIGEALGKEKVAMAMTGPWTLGFLKGSYPDVYKKIGVVEMPSLIKKSTMVYTVSWSINRSTPHKSEAWEVLKFLVTRGQEIFVKRAGVLASRKDIAAKDTDPIKVPFYKGAEYAYPWRVPTPTGIFSVANDQINSRLKDLFYGKITLDEALKQIKENYLDWVSGK